jgi:hypothetical protein
MPPFLSDALSTLAKDTGLSGFVPVPGGDASSPPFSNGLSDLSAIPTNPELNTISTQPLRPGAVPKPPPVDFKHKAYATLGTDNIAKYLNDLYQKKDPNIAFQDLVKKVVGQTFTTPGAINPQMNEIIASHYNKFNQAALNHINKPRDGGAENAFYNVAAGLGEYLKNGATSGGGRKTARNHKRSRSRGRSRKQYKKLKRSSRNRRR